MRIYFSLFLVFIAYFHVADGADVNKDNISALRKQLKSKDEAVAYQATAELAVQYRSDGDLEKAENNRNHKYII